MLSAGSHPVTWPPAAPQPGGGGWGMGGRGLGRGRRPSQTSGRRSCPGTRRRAKTRLSPPVCSAVFLGRKQKRVAQRFLIFRH